MKLDYSGARNLEEARAIHKAFWDNIHKELAEGKWKPISREEFIRQLAAVRERARKKKEQEEREDNDVTPSA
jgi:hypothetical protein